MVTVIRQIGAHRSGTNYCQWLMINNFDDIIFMYSILGSKHFSMPNFYHNVDWVNGQFPLTNEQMDKIVRQLEEQTAGWKKSCGSATPWACSSNCLEECAYPNPKAVEHIKEAIKTASIKFVMCIKNPYAWFLSSIKHKPLKNLSRKEVIGKKISEWVALHEEWFQIYEKNKEAFFIFKYEDVIENTEGMLKRISKKFDLKETRKKFINNENRLAPNGKVTKNKFDKNFYIKRLYMEQISQKDIEIFRAFLPSELIEKMGYKIY